MGAIVVTKEVAKKMIDEAPGDFVIISKINIYTHEYIPSKKIKKIDGKEFLNAAKRILYQDDDFFGILSCDLIQNQDEEEIRQMLHNLIFPQLE